MTDSIQPEQAPTPAGFALYRSKNFQIVADWSWLLVFALITFNLGAGLLPRWHPTWNPIVVWVTAVFASILFFASVLAHELSHVAVARLYNIKVHGITLFLFGGMAHIESEAPHPKAECLMAAAGPAVSLAIGVAATAFGGWLAGPIGNDPMIAIERLSVLPTLLLWLGPVNLMLGLFNLLPGFPLDGGRVLRATLWWAFGDLRKATYWASRVGQVLAWMLITLGLLMVFSIRVPVFGVGIQGLWLVLIGWFLNNAARASYHEVVVAQILHNGQPAHKAPTGAFR